MRLWSIHPSYLDAKGLVALWREALLAQKVLQGRTKGYTRHPQLERFKSTCDPAGAIAAYLRGVADEAQKRGYRFDRSRIADAEFEGTLPVTQGQRAYEFGHLLQKLKKRDVQRCLALKCVEKVELHPLFMEVEGDVEAWEVVPAE